MLRLKARNLHIPRTGREGKQFLDPGLARVGQAGLVSRRKLSRNCSKVVITKWSQKGVRRSCSEIHSGDRTTGRPVSLVLVKVIGAEVLVRELLCQDVVRRLASTRQRREPSRGRFARSTYHTLCRFPLTAPALDVL